MGRTVRAEAGGVQGAPLAASAEDEEDGIHRLAIINAGPMASQGMRLARREERHDTLPQRVRDTPVIMVFLIGIRHQASAWLLYGKRFSPYDTIK